MTLADWLIVAGACTLGAASPGPSLAVVAHHALNGSRVQGLACAGGHALGVGVYALATVVGLAAVLTAHPGLYRAIALAGAAYLLWLAWQAWRSGASDEAAAMAVPAGAAGAARRGLAMALLNPKIALFFLAVFAPFAGPAPGWAEGVVLWATATGVDGAWYAGVVLALRRLGRRARWAPPAAAVDRAMALVLVGVAAWTVWRVAAGGP